MKLRRFRAIVCSVSVGIWALSGVTTAKADGFLPVVQPYESFNDSPFKGMGFTWFDLVSMTKLSVPSGTLFNGLVPGVTTDVPAEVLGPGAQLIPWMGRATTVVPCSTATARAASPSRSTRRCWGLCRPPPALSGPMVTFLFTSLRKMPMATRWGRLTITPAVISAKAMAIRPTSGSSV